MFPSRWRVPALVVLPAAIAAAAGLSGCGGSAGSASGTSTAGTVAQHAPISAAQLRSALLRKINGEPASAPPTAGAYASLPEVQAEQRLARSSSIRPESCAREVFAGMENRILAGAPAATVSFRVGRNGLSETLVAPTADAAAAAMSTTLSSGCGHYRAQVGGKTYRYTVKEHEVTGIGEQARVLNLETDGQPGNDMWSVMYRGPGFIGAITVVGPNASELAVRELGLQAYGYAARTLS